jgi:kinesin family protein 22
LLSDNGTLGSGLDLRQNGADISIPGLKSETISSLEDFNRQHQLASKNRCTASTKLNHESSRSHLIVKLTVQSSILGKEVVSKVHLVDLCGSENNRRTGNSGSRLEESCAINKSLFVLGI